MSMSAGKARGSAAAAPSSALDSDLTIVSSGGPLGAEVRGVDLSVPLEEPTVSRLRAAWLEHLLLLFRGQKLSDQQLVALARHFGEPHIVTFFDYNRAGMLPEIEVISNIVVKGKAMGGGGAGELVWHTDIAMFEYPASATVLYGEEIPPAGGNTRFSNMYAAYETLPQALKNRVEGRRALFDKGGGKPGYSVNSTDNPCAIHPIVSTHPEAGRKALFLGRRDSGLIQGLNAEEASSLREQLWERATRPDLIWEHPWRPGDVLIWDNRCLSQARGAFASNARRVLRRVTIKGEKPV